MKRLLVFALICALLCPAALADVQSQVSAPAHATDTFLSNTGKTVITIDADVTVPTMDKIPIYLVSPRLFTAEEMTRAADVLLGKGKWTGSAGYSEQNSTGFDGAVRTHYLAELDTIEQTEGLYWPVAVSVVRVQAQRLANGMMHETFLRYSRWNGEAADATHARYNVEDGSIVSPADGRGPNRCAITLEEAKAQADVIAAQIAPHMAYAGCGIKHECIQDTVRPGQYSAVLNTEGLREAWVFYYAPVYDLPCNFAKSGLADYNYSVSCREESLCVIIDDEGIQDLYWYQPYDIVDTLQEDCSLLPFDSIMQVARSILPLTLVSYEREGTGAKARITDIRLGYLRVMRPDQPDTLTLIPVWDFYGSVTFNGSYVQNWACHSWLTINAIDGTVIDRQYGY